MPLRWVAAVNETQMCFELALGEIAAGWHSPEVQAQSKLCSDHHCIAITIFFLGSD